MTELTTTRLLLRQWRDSDLAPLAALHADLRVMQFMPGCLSRQDSDAFAARARRELGQRGFGRWALEVRASGQFAGYVGLSAPSFTAAFTPCIEIAWRLAHEYWGLGYAIEAARECLRFAFGELDLPEVVAFTVPANARSRALMHRLGMHHDAAADFEHPRLPPGDPLRRHVLYRLSRAAWAAAPPG